MTDVHLQPSVAAPTAAPIAGAAPAAASIAAAAPIAAAAHIAAAAPTAAVVPTAASAPTGAVPGRAAFGAAALASFGAAVAGLVLASALGAPAVAAPFVPQSGAQVLETLPRRADGPDAALRERKARLAAAPRDADLAADVAQRYIALGRAASDPRYFGYAQAALAPWWAAPAPPSQVRLLRAILLQANHQFTAALRDLDGVTRAQPRNAQAWLTQATVQAVTGDHTAAVGSCARLSTLASQLSSIACLANARAGMGALPASERLLALALARATDDDDAVRSWALTLLGELASRRGDAAAAETRYRQALAIAPDDSYLLGAYADLLLDQRRPAEAIVLLRGRHRVDSLLLRHALALAAGGDGDGDRVHAASMELAARFDAAARRGDATHLREQARFELHLRGDARSALRLALANWKTQKEAADLRILLESAQRARDPSAVREALAWRRQRGFEDAASARLARELEGGRT